MTHEQLYARLRAETLARHFALGRFARAEHFDQQAFLGTWSVAADDDDHASPGGITIETAVKVDWSVTIENGECIVSARFHERTLLPPDGRSAVQGAYPDHLGAAARLALL